MTKSHIEKKILETHLFTETKGGLRIKNPATLVISPSEIEFKKAPFHLKGEIKAMMGSRWHGYDRENPRKVWTVDNCPRNWFQLKYLMGINAYEWFERPLVNYEYDKPLMDHQKLMTDTGLTYHYQIWGAEMGCIDGDAIVHVNRAGRGFEITLRELYRRFHKQQRRGRKWSPHISTFIRSLKSNELGLNEIIDVVDKGTKKTLKLILASGKELKLTPDHEVATGWDLHGNIQFTRVDRLSPNNSVLSNGRWVDKDGYVRVGGLKGKHPRWTTGGVYEHIIIMEESIGRYIKVDEIVHHINKIRHDNRLENLQLLESNSVHAKLHSSCNRFNLNSEKCPFVPYCDKVESIIECGECHVYDIVCKDPHRNFVANGVVVHNCGKTLSAQCLIEMSGCESWFWVGPLKSLENMEREWKKWDLQLSWIKPKDGNKLIEAVAANEHNIYLTTYERLVKFMEVRSDKDHFPAGVIFDESSRLKSPTAKRSLAAQDLADKIRADYGNKGYVILMSGTPSPKSPLDWWKPCEITWPGYLKEGSKDQLEKRLGFMVQQELPDNVINVRIGWKDNVNKCLTCARTKDEGDHAWDMDDPEKVTHQFEKSENEVSYMYERLDGLATIIHKKDVLQLPDKVYEVDICEPSPSILRVAKTLANSAPNVMTGATWLRELSDGFLYKQVPDGQKQCSICVSSEQPGKVQAWFDPEAPDDPIRSIDMLDEEYVKSLHKEFVDCPQCDGTQLMVKTKRVTREVTCPKEDKLKDRLAQSEETGRIVIFAGFQGSIDRIRKICFKQGWDVVQCDGRGWRTFDKTGKKINTDKPLDYWADLEHYPQVAFVAHPKSGGMSLTLVEARMAVYWSNSFEPESRAQSEARIHRKGMDENIGCKIVDIYHLPTDAHTHNILKENRKLELQTMGEFSACLK